MNTDVDTELTRDNLNNRGGQTESKPVDRCYFTRTEKGVRGCFKVPLEFSFIEGPNI